VAAATVNPAVLNALTLKWGQTKADLDDQQNRQRINYNSVLDKMRRAYTDTELTNREGFSDRGMLHAGPSLANQTKLRGDYTRQQGEATQARNSNLATIARRRLEADQTYNTNKLLAAAGYTA
jgi:hypothetical protein